MRRIILAALSIVAVLFIAACGGKGSSADPPTDFKAVARDGQVVLSWTMTPGVDYWLFYGAASSITPDTVTTTPGGKILINVVSPLVLSGLANGTTYAFAINGRINSGPGGAGSPSVSATPRLAGAIWNDLTAFGSTDMRGIAFGAVLVAAGAGGTMFSSADGTTWTPINFTVATDLNAAYYFGGIYLAAGAGGVVLSSADAVTWVAQTTGTSNTLFSLATNSSNLTAAVGAAGTIITSANGTSWTSVASGTTSNLYGVTFGGGRWVAVGAAGTLLTSTDGATWQAVASNTSADLRSVAFRTSSSTAGAVIYAAVGANGTLVTSPDGLTWTVQAPITLSTLNGIVFGTQFVAVGAGGTILTSTDGIAWAPQASGTTNNLNAIIHPPGSYSVVGSGGLYLSSR